jgi:hypothetical protein
LASINQHMPDKRQIIPTDERFIDRDAEFAVAYIIPASDSRNRRGISVDEYLRDYGGFEFHFDYDIDGEAQSFSYQFSYETVEKWLRDAEAQWREQHKKPPGLRQYK